MTVRVAVVGAGSMGKNHARVLQSLPGAELVAVVDSDLATARGVSHLHGGKAHTALADALASRVDAAIVAVPTQHHYETTKTLLAAGVHVLVEKPIAATVDEARSLGEIARREKRVLAVGHVERFNPAIQLLARKLAEGALGRVLEVRARRVGPFPARIRDVGVALDRREEGLELSAEGLDLPHEELGHRALAHAAEHAHLRPSDRRRVGVLVEVEILREVV
ncbi:MAG: Gfo/Idh/MocA family oxidoreductase, partial [Deltaproteobacteria bacterium]